MQAEEPRKGRALLSHVPYSHAPEQFCCWVAILRGAKTLVPSSQFLPHQLGPGILYLSVALLKVQKFKSSNSMYVINAGTPLHPHHDYLFTILSSSSHTDLHNRKTRWFVRLLYNQSRKSSIGTGEDKKMWDLLSGLVLQVVPTGEKEGEATKIKLQPWTVS